MKHLVEWQERLETELEHLKAEDRYRTLRSGNTQIDFSSNDYLSLNQSGRLVQIFKEAVAESGPRVGSTGSRLLSGHHPCFDAAETEFSCFAGYPSSLLFHSGYAANVGTLQALLTARDIVFCDRLCHASILDGIRISGARRYYFQHNDLNDLECQIKKRTGGHRAANVWVVTEAVFSMDGDVPDLAAIVQLAERYGLLIYLDEAHAIGVVGKRGEGLSASLGLQNQIAVAVYPCGKAPGAAGAFVCGTESLRNSLINRCRSFIFSTAQPPVLAELLRRVVVLLPQLNAERAQLTVLQQSFRKKVMELGLAAGASSTHIVPVILGQSERSVRWMKHLLAARLDVRAIRPPTVAEGTARLRVNLQAGHTTEDLELLSKELYNLLESERSFS